MTNAFYCRNVHVGNTPHVQDDAVAEFAVALTLAASRRMFEGANAILAYVSAENNNNKI